VKVCILFPIVSEICVNVSVTSVKKPGEKVLEPPVAKSLKSITASPAPPKASKPILSKRLFPAKSLTSVPNKFVPAKSLKSAPGILPNVPGGKELAI